MPTVLVIAPGHGGRGGIDSVVRMHQTTETWRRMRCRLFPTYDDRNAVRKVRAAINAYLRAPRALSSATLVHLHLAGEISLLRKLPLILMAKLMRKPLILHVHAGSEESLFQKTPAWAWKCAFNAADRVIALSPAWAAILRRHLPRTEIVVIPNPVRIAPEPPPQGAEHCRVLFAGKLEARKGFLTLLDAAAVVLAEHPSVEFWFAGHGALPEARAHAAKLGIASQVHLLGWVDHTHLAELYAQASIFCLPSHNEGVPMALLEAMSHSLPVITTPVGGIPDVVTSEYNGLLVPPGDAEALATALIRLLRSPVFAYSLAENGRRTVEAQCSIAETDHALGALYASLDVRRQTATAAGGQRVSLEIEDAS
ncbi:glycosyltransferase family 4 protein [Acidipila sp. EB88]|uniref:glycosyltransferase family 4 protein n=1 Tax=Acidipila sp. EB88 TaxID=2305226 RepID=UPI0013158B18|nr:glycosyltransferase family 4 protein [Acidipila sp. EB88]